MATIHKLTKDGATIFPATITDAIVHPDTGKTLTSMMKEYNVSELFPSEGIDGGNKYNLTLALQVLSSHLTSAQKVGGVKITFISSVSPYPEEEYYLGKNTWSTTPADWKQRFEVGDVIANPSGSWEQGTAEAYIDQQVAEITNDLAKETIGRQQVDTNLQTQLNSEVSTRIASDNTQNNNIAALQAAYRGLTENDVIVGPRPSNGQQANVIYREPDQGHTPPQFYADYMWYNNAWVLMAQYDNGIDDNPLPASNNLVKSSGVFNSMGAYDISADHSGQVYQNLTAALADVPQDMKAGGISVKFIQTTPAQYAVIKNENLETQPTGTALSTDPNIISGTYTADQLNNLNTASALPSTLNSSKTYYLEVSTGNYTSWIVTYVQTSDNKYVQYRCMAQNFTTDVTQWQGVDTEIVLGSHNLIESGAVAKRFNEGIDYDVKAVDFTSNKAIHARYGNVGNNANKRCTEGFIEIPEGAKYIVVNRYGSTYCPTNGIFDADNHTTSGLYSVELFYYQSNSESSYMPYTDYASGNLLSNGSGHIPTGAKYVRLNDNVAYTNGHLLTFYYDLPNYDDYVEEKQKINLPSNEWISGYRLTVTGLVTYASSAGVTKKTFNVKGAKYITHNLNYFNTSTDIPGAEPTYRQIQLYDATGKVVMFTTDIIVNIPETAVMMECYDLNPATKSCYVELYPDGDDNTDTKIDRLNKSVNDPAANYEYGLLSWIDGMSNARYYQRWDVISANYMRTTGPIPVILGDTFKYRLFVYGNTPKCIRLLDENLTVLDIISTDNAINEGTYTVTSPLVKYIVFDNSYRTSNVDVTTLYLRKVYTQGKYSIVNSESVMQAFVQQIEQLKAKLTEQEVDVSDIMPADYQISTEAALADRKSKGISNLLSFAVFTDAHYKVEIDAPSEAGGDTLHTYPRLASVIKYLYNKGQIQFAAALGDNVHSAQTGNYDAFKGVLADAGCPYAVLVGNHDTFSPVTLRDGQCTIEGYVRGNEHNDTWYYFDIDDIRFVVLNPLDKKADDDSGTNSREWNYKGISSYQISWLINTLNTTKKVMFLSHLSIDDSHTNYPDDWKSVTDVVEAFIDGPEGTAGSVVMTSEEVTIPYDFTGQQAGVVLGVLCGHEHCDSIIKVRDKYSNIWVDNALGLDWFSWATNSTQGNMTLGTYTEIAMDIVTIDKTTGNVYLSRIGRGGNREVINSEE